MSNYREMTDPEFLAAVGVDALKWAEAFCQLNPSANMDEGLMVSWFSNAMMAMHDHLRGGPTVLPDGSAFFVAEVGS